MNNKSIAKSLIRTSVYAGVALSMYGLSTSNALAWGSYGSWTSPGNTGTCHTNEIDSQTFIYLACDGQSFAGGTTLTALNKADGQGGNKTEARGFYASSAYISVTAYGTWSYPNSDTSAQVNASSNIQAHQCRCEGTWYPL